MSLLSGVRFFLYFLKMSVGKEIRMIFQLIQLRGNVFCFYLN